jgi:hypothetical protein
VFRFGGSERAPRNRFVRIRPLFVAAVGLGPFAGMLGIGLHTLGSAAKLIADQIETVRLDPLHAIETTGAGRVTAIIYALLPDIAPVVLSTTLFWWELNVRASTVLGVVGAGGVGQELKNSMDLLDVPRLFTIIAVILIVVTILDQVSGWIRAKLVGAPACTGSNGVSRHYRCFRRRTPISLEVESLGNRRETAGGWRGNLSHSRGRVRRGSGTEWRRQNDPHSLSRAFSA